MKTILEDGRIKLEASDWRYSAAILGLIRYFEAKCNLIDYELQDDYIIYKKEDITKENYVKYILERFKDTDFAYIVLKNKLQKDTYTEEEIKEINKYIKGCPETIKKLKLEFDGTNQEELLKILDEKKEDLVLEIFNNRDNNGYAKFCNAGGNGHKKIYTKSKLFKEDGKSCRINGFYVDPNRKRSLLMWANDSNTFESDDIQEFDFIPFSFSMDYDSLFINNNFSIQSLIDANSHFNDENCRITLYKYISELADKNIENNIEIIIKENTKNYFETLYIDRFIIDKIKKIKDIEGIKTLEKLNIKIRDDFWINMSYILQLIFNRQNLDSVIHIILKNKDLYKKYNYYLKFIIQINMILYEKGNIEMIKQYKSAYACAKSISEKLDENKLNSYRQKLTSAMISNNKTSVYNILIQLSNYSHVNISFIFDILDDFDLNKNQIYAFISALTKQKKEVEKND